MNIGNELQKARKENGLSIEELQKKTKIRKKYLIALENNDFSEIKGDVYVKSFIKGYARAIGINPDPFIYEYEQYISNKKPDKKNKNNEINNKGSNKNNHFKQIAVIILIIIIIGTIGFFIYSNFIATSDPTMGNSNVKVEDSLNDNINLNENELDSITSIEKNEFNISENSFESKDNLDLEENNITFDIPDNFDKENEVNKEVTKNEKDSNSSEKTEKKEEKKEEKTQEENIQEKEKISIKIVASQKTWLRVTLNKKNNNEILYEGFMNNNQEDDFIFNYNNSITLRIGNGEGIYILNNEEKYGPWGERGEVIEKNIYFENKLQIK